MSTEDQKRTEEKCTCGGPLEMTCARCGKAHCRECQCECMKDPS